MGGHRGGDVASSLALETVEALFRDGDGTLAEQVREANRAVLERSVADQQGERHGHDPHRRHGRGHATPASCHVGDSRAYLLRAGDLRQLTSDHTLVARMVKAGEISREEAAVHPHRNVVTQVASAPRPTCVVDEEDVPLLDGDRLLLCSDGLTGMVAEDQIQAILEAEPDPQDAADRLVKAANRAGGVDNITVVVLDVARPRTTATRPPGKLPKRRRGAPSAAATRWSPGPGRGDRRARGARSFVVARTTSTASGTWASPTATSRCSKASRPTARHHLVRRRHADRDPRRRGRRSCRVYPRPCRRHQRRDRDDAYAIVEQIRTTWRSRRRRTSGGADGRRRDGRRGRVAVSEAAPSPPTTASRAGHRPVAAGRRARDLARDLRDGGPRPQGRTPRDIVRVRRGVLRRLRGRVAGGAVDAPREPTPCCFPTATALAGLGIAMLYRIMVARGESTVAREQAIWLLVGLAAFCLTLWFVRDDRQLNAYTYTLGLVGVVLLLLPVVPGHRARDQRGAAVGAGRAVLVPAGGVRQDPDRRLPGVLPDRQARAARRRRRAGSGCRAPRTSGRCCSRGARRSPCSSSRGTWARRCCSSACSS